MILCFFIFYQFTLFQLLLPTTIQKKNSENITSKQNRSLYIDYYIILLSIKDRCIKQNYILNLILKMIVLNILDTHKENKPTIKFKTDTQ